MPTLKSFRVEFSCGAPDKEKGIEERGEVHFIPATTKVSTGMCQGQKPGTRRSEVRPDQAVPKSSHWIGHQLDFGVVPCREWNGCWLTWDERVAAHQFPALEVLASQQPHRKERCLCHRTNRYRWVPERSLNQLEVRGRDFFPRLRVADLP